MKIPVAGNEKVSSEIVIQIESLTKNYRIFNHPSDRIRQALNLGQKVYFDEFSAIKDISFKINRGEIVGVIGRNGSGKSTLLQLICGILKPSFGSVRLNGRVSALLELGGGFNPEFTGRENVFFQGAIMGVSRKVMEKRFSQIAEFAEIGDFIDRPVRTYSTGMFVRLAFSIAINTDPDILIVDEALSVGDFLFQQKCLEKIKQLSANGVTILFVSHDTGLVRDLCNRVLYLKEGSLQFFGNTRQAMQLYFSDKQNVILKSNSFENINNYIKNKEVEKIIVDSIWCRGMNALGEDSGFLIAVACYDELENPRMSFNIGESLFLKIVFIPNLETSNHVSLEIWNKHNHLVSSVGSSSMKLSSPNAHVGELVIFEMNIKLQLEAGEYSIVINQGHKTGPNLGICLDSTGAIGPISVSWDYELYQAPFLGMVGLPVEGKFKTVGTASL